MPRNSSTSFSIIIPTYQEDSIIEMTLSQIRNVIDNSNFDCELIVVDGGSVDQTIDIARLYTNKAYNIKKRGISLARNFGARKAKNNIYSFIDADVILQRDFFDKLGSVFESNGIAGANCDVRPLPEVNPSYFETAFFFLWGNIRNGLYKIRPCGTGENGIFVRKEIFDKVNGFDENLITIEDLDFVFRASRHGKFVFLKDPKIYETIRRFRKLGVMQFSAKYMHNFLYYSVFKRSRVHEWEPIR